MDRWTREEMFSMLDCATLSESITLLNVELMERRVASSARRAASRVAGDGVCVEGCVVGRSVDWVGVLGGLGLVVGEAKRSVEESSALG